MAPKSFVLTPLNQYSVLGAVILTPLNQYSVLGAVRDVTSLKLSHEQTQSNLVCCFPTL